MDVGLGIWEFGRRERFSFWFTWVGLVGILVGAGVLVAELLGLHELAGNAAKGVGDADVVV